jgi:hypothetical protein
MSEGCRAEAWRAQAGWIDATGPLGEACRHFHERWLGKPAKLHQKRNEREWALSSAITHGRAPAQVRVIVGLHDAASGCDAKLPQQSATGISTFSLTR